MGASWENRAINYWSKAYNTGWFGVDGVEILIILLWIVMRAIGATHSGFLVNTRRNADLFVGGLARLGPSDQASHDRVINKKWLWWNYTGTKMGAEHH